jgi:hypothetical protein
VILAVSAFSMMQVPVDEVIDVVAMRHGFVAATGSMGMALFMAATIVVLSCGPGISGVDGNDVLVYMALVRMVHVPVVEIIRVSFMLDCGMPTPGTMLM